MRHDINTKAYILDSGCGEGQWLEKEGGSKVVGIDVNLTYLKVARQKAIEGTNFILCDGLHLPFKDKSFRMVHVNGVLYHIGDFKSEVDEINRVLDGRLDITEVVDDNFLFRTMRRIAKNWRSMPITFFTSAQLENKIKQYFIINSIEYRDQLKSPFLFIYLGILQPQNRILCYASELYNALLQKLRLSKVLASKVSIVAYNNKC